MNAKTGKQKTARPTARQPAGLSWIHAHVAFIKALAILALHRDTPERLARPIRNSLFKWAEEFMETDSSPTSQSIAAVKRPKLTTKRPLPNVYEDFLLELQRYASHPETPAASKRALAALASRVETEIAGIEVLPLMIGNTIKNKYSAP